MIAQNEGDRAGVYLSGLLDDIDQMLKHVRLRGIQLDDDLTAKITLLLDRVQSGQSAEGGSSITRPPTPVSVEQVIEKAQEELREAQTDVEKRFSKALDDAAQESQAVVAKAEAEALQNIRETMRASARQEAEKRLAESGIRKEAEEQILQQMDDLFKSLTLKFDPAAVEEKERTEEEHRPGQAKSVE